LFWIVAQVGVSGVFVCGERVAGRRRELVLPDLTMWKGLLQLYEGGEKGCSMVEKEFGTGKEVGV
jgi:hypothetical protein